MEAGGELRLKARTYDSLDRSRFLVVDYDAEKAEVVLKCTTPPAVIVPVQPESYSWALPAEASPREQQRIEAQRLAQKRIVRSDEELAALEETRTREAQLAREASEGALPKHPFRTDTTTTAK